MPINVVRAVGIVTVLVFSMSSVGSVASETETDVTDGQITRQVEEQLLYDPAVPFNDIDVNSKLKIVTLSGTVDNLLEKQRAEKLAGIVRGVRSVINRIEVKPNRRLSSVALEREVKGALIHNPATESFEIDVKADREGKVTLSGEVDSWQERALSGTVASGVLGVTDIDNQLVIHMDGKRSGIEIQKEVEQVLKWDALVKGELIDVRMKDDKIHLSGIVGSAAEKQRAVSDAWNAGVEGVDASKLEVSKWARNEDLRNSEYTPLPDSEIRLAVTTALLKDPRVPASRVSASVYKGRVTLMGIVRNGDAKHAAEQDAYNTTGVRRVKNLIKVRPPADIRDARIARDLRRALQRNPYLSDQDIAIVVNDKKVVLKGVVETTYEKALAEIMASQTGGVAEVANRLSIEDNAYLTFNPYVSDWEYSVSPWEDAEMPTQVVSKSDRHILEEIDDELVWSPFVDADEVKVTVKDGVAYLEGEVDSWLEARAAVSNALEGGAFRVVSSLQVQ